MILQSIIIKCLKQLLERWCGVAGLTALVHGELYNCFLFTSQIYCNLNGQASSFSFFPKLSRSPYALWVFHISGSKGKKGMS